MMNPIMAAVVLADIKVNAPDEVKLAYQEYLKSEGEDCATCDKRDDCPIYDAIKVDEPSLRLPE